MKEKRTKEGAEMQTMDRLTREQIDEMTTKLFGVQGYLALLGQVFTTSGNDDFDDVVPKLLHLNADIEQKIDDVINVFMNSTPLSGDLVVEKGGES